MGVSEFRQKQTKGEGSLKGAISRMSYIYVPLMLAKKGKKVKNRFSSLRGVLVALAGEGRTQSKIREGHDSENNIFYIYSDILRIINLSKLIILENQKCCNRIIHSNICSSNSESAVHS